VHGIEVTDNCVVRDNVILGNGTVGGHAGVRITGVRNLVDGNKLQSNRAGVRSTGERNMIVRNFLSSSTDNHYNLATNNYVYSVVANQHAPAINANSGGTTTTTWSDNPAANVSY
jgi:hypothetical protein